MKNSITLLFWIIASSILFSAKALANEGQFYFTAMSAPMGASSQVGKGSNGVYLRWDLVEGDLPADITRFELKRDGEIILAKNINDLMPQNEIHRIYVGAAEQQRLLQTITLLKKLSLANNASFDASNFPAELYNRFNNVDDKAWVFLASRQNFDIARARYRAFLDTTASGVVTYTLHVFNAAGNSGQLGKVTVNTSLNSHQILPVSNFRQLETLQCDIANSMKDHYTVLLDWKAPGNANITDRSASALQMAGYQIYRSTSNIGSAITEAPVRDIAAEAVVLAHDQRGDIQFSDLERVNEFLVVAEGYDTDGQREPAFIETPEQLAAAGLKPGDKRAYYIVPVDFAGHLGQTEGAIIQVPDRQMPATPWNIKFHQSMGELSRASLEWDASTLDNYTANFSNTRVICNAQDAVTSGKIEYADEIEACDEPVHTRIDISNYLVYRFDSAQQANRFSDSDGDGFSDVDERNLNSNSCDSGSVPQNTSNFLVANDNFISIDLANNRSKIRYNDSYLTQPENIGKAFWYRLASITADGNVSPLSAPVQGLFWDRELPPKPTFTATTAGNCCEIISQGSGEWSFNDDVEQLGSLSLAFSNNPGSQTVPVSMLAFASSQSTICNAKDSPILSFWGLAPDRELIYPGQQPGSLQQAYCRVNVPDNMDLCKTGAWRLAKTSCQQPVADGDIVDAAITYTINAPEAGSCVSVWKRIAGQNTRVASSCGTDTPETLNYLTEPGFCGFTQTLDASGNISPMAALPCTTPASNLPPSAPQIISFVAGQNSSDFSWRLPLEPVAVTLIEITSDVDESLAEASDKQLISVPNAGFNPGMLFSDSSVIHERLGQRDQWCIRMKSLAPTTQDVAQALSSDWSNRLCSTRRLTSNLSTDYLPWPKLDSVSVQHGFTVFSAKDYMDAAQGMAYEKMPLIIPITSPPVNQQTDCTIHDRTENYDEVNADNTGLLLFGRDVFCPSLNSAQQLQKVSLYDLPFIVYRQARTAQGNLGKWVQVSPLIDNIHWEFSNDAKLTGWGLQDPYFKFFRLGYSSTLPWVLSFVDRYPHRADYEYRYQLVTFTKEHAIEKIYISAGENDTWVKAAGLGANQ